jgi:capsid protein
VDLDEKQRGKKVEKEKLPPEVVFHSKIDVDSTEKRGISRFYPIIRWMKRLQGLVDNEVTHRTLQSSIVLVRKTMGGTSAAQGLLNNARTSTTNYSEGTISREKIRPGSILTVSQGTEIDFAHPQNAFSDASPLVKVLIIHLCAATGFTYGMVTTDSADGSFASSLTNESPVLQMVLDERKFFRDELVPIFKWVIESAIENKLIEGVTKEDVWERFDPDFLYGDIVSRDAVKDSQAANLGVMMGAISKREASRRLKADPDKMQREIQEEMETSIDQMMTLGVSGSPMNPTLADKMDSSKSNANNGGGTNQGKGDPIQHKDKVS